MNPPPNLPRLILSALLFWGACAHAAVVDAVFNSASNVPVTAPAYSATGNTVNLSLGFAPATGTNLTVVNNTGLGFISGVFGNIAQGQVVSLPYNGVIYPFVANYYGGTGNDMVLHWAAQELATWGGNDSGVLGNGDTWYSTVPVSVTNTSALSGKTVIAVAQSTSGYHSLALCSDGTLAAWGNNTYGQLGNGAGGAGVSSNVPVSVIRGGALAGKTVVAVAVGEDHSLALCSDGTVAGWGGNDNGQLGNNSTAGSKVPVPLTKTGVLAGKTVVSISAGLDFSLALCSDGTLAAWGTGSSGQLGNGSTQGRLVPVLVTKTGVLAGKNVVAISAGAYTSFAVCSDGSIASWGSNYKGQLGNGGTADSAVPVEVTRTGVLSGKTVVAVSSSGLITVALCSDNTMAAWGDNYYGQLGYTGVSTLPASSNVPLLVTQNVALAGKKVVGISVGVSHSLALYSDGSLATWGYNGLGQLGNNTTKYEIRAVNITQNGVLAGKTVVGVSAGTSTSLAMVARPISKVSTLAGLTFSTGTLNPAFDTTNTSYTLSVPANTTSVSVTPTTTFSAATVRVNGTAVASGTESTPIPLAGNDTITVLVTAQDGTTQSTYTIAVKYLLDANFVTANSIPAEAPSYNASGNDVHFTLGFAPTTGTNLTVINNTGLSFIAGTFANLAHRQQVSLTYNGVTYRFVANYFGSTGNDLVLQWAYQDLLAWGDNSKGALGNNSTTGSSVPVAVAQSGALFGKTILAVAGSSHSLALCSDGTLAAWGDNHSGQLGNGNTADSSVPVTVTQSGVLAGKTVVAIAAGAGHSLALCSDGTLAAWGGNSSGQLGNNSKTGSSVPVAVYQSGAIAGKSVVAISASGNHSLVLCSDGTLAAWGENSAGQLGNGNITQSSIPTVVSQSGVLAGKTPVAIAAGHDFCIVLCSDSTLAAWGNNSSGQLGDNSTTSRNVPGVVTGSGILSGKTVVSIAAGFAHSLVRCLDGTLAAWGQSNHGQIGNGSTLGSSVPVAVNQSGMMAAKTAVAISAGGYHSFTRCSDGTLFAWGRNSSGQLGNNSTTDSSVPVTVTPGGILAGKTTASVAAASAHSLALVAKPIAAISTLSGLAVGSGSLSPNFSTIITSYTVSVPSTTTSITVTPAVTYPAATIRVNGTLVASGAASAPIALAIGVNTITVQVTAEDGLTQSSYTIAATRGVLNATFTSTDSIPVEAPSYSASGYDVAFSLGFVPSTGATLTVVNNTGLGFIIGRFGNLAQGQAVNLNYNGVAYPFVANYYGGNGNDLVLQWAMQDLVAWGYNGTGELGNGSTTSSSVPTLVSQGGVLAGKTVIAFAAGANHNLALCSDGTLAAWGYNGRGELGDGGITNSSVPVAVVRTGVLSGKTVIAVAAGYRHSVVLCSDGTLATWGYNDYGQLGNNSMSGSSVPVAVVRNGALSGKTVVSVTAGSSHAIVLCSDGTLAGWGRNDNGQIGGGAGYSSSVPVVVTPSGVLAGKLVISIRTGTSHNLALCSDGTVGLWGYNDLGQIGNGSSTINSGVYVPTTAVQTGLLAGKTKIAIAAGDYHSFTLCSDGTLAAWGYNSDGQLGTGSSNYATNVPVAVVRSGVLAGKTITALVARFHNLALCSDGTFVSWGQNYNGMLGRTGNNLVPAAVTLNGALAGKKVVSIAAGHGHSLVMAAVPLPTAPIMSGPATSADITDTAATLGGNVVSDGNNAITERGIVYSLTAGNANPQIGGTGVTRLVVPGTTGVFTVRASGLSGLTAYSFKAYAISSLGITYTSPVSNFTTLAADLAISMTAGPSPVIIGGTLTYTIQVTNVGTYEATVVNINDTLDPALSFVSAAVPSGWTTILPASGSSGLVSFSKTKSLKIGETASFTIIATVRTSVPTGTVIVNHATAFNPASDSNPANNTATTNTPVGTIKPTPVQLGTTGTINSQTGLFNLTVNVRNTTPQVINGFRLYVDYSAYKSTHPSLRLYNASSPKGSAEVFVDFPYPVSVDGTIPVGLAFYTSNRTFPKPFKPVLRVEILPTSAVSNTTGDGVQPRLVRMDGGNVLIEFPSVPGSWYRVSFSPDLINWFDCPFPIEASATRTQWIDSGAPLTPVPPSQAPSRYYRVNKIKAR